MEGCLSTIMEGCPSKKLLISCKACRELTASGGSIWASVEQEGIVGHSISAQRRVPLWTIFDPELSTGWLRLPRGYSEVWGSSYPLLFPSCSPLTGVRPASQAGDSLCLLLISLSFFFQQKLPSIHLLHFSVLVSASQRTQPIKPLKSYFHIQALPTLF